LQKKLNPVITGIPLRGKKRQIR